ncbi:KAP family P-loop NTPase fold protein [Kocuria oceani]|uniref:P-loop NTPase fold protein n=1 Tax=Kocuria oceani TaxID=988827 RepID=A0ABV9TJR8_9MICC|nr:P-loop NTPase fold protein [Kocuria oceani]
MKRKADEPIENTSEDLLSRADGAVKFAKRVLDFDLSRGLVVGVLGPWGSGKTSFLNMARPEMERNGATVLDYNPWMFSGADQLVESFFAELSAQLKVKPELEEISKNISKYGQAFSKWDWLPFVGPWIERGKGVGDLIVDLMELRSEGVVERRKKLQEVLEAAENPIVVVLDDIDRLSTSEIRDVFKLVRLTASFPYIVYVLSFDRARVEAALREDGIPGRDYLEKILQLAIDLPAVPESSLKLQTLNSLVETLSNLEWIDDVDRKSWPDVYSEIISPLVKNMRDVKRYAAAVEGTIESLGGQIALSDIMALEAIRTFLPDLYLGLQRHVPELTSTFDVWTRGQEDPELVRSIEKLLESNGDQEKLVRSTIMRLFPAASRHIGGPTYSDDYKRIWLRTRRVAHESNLRLYFEQMVGETLLAFNSAQNAWNLMSDSTAFASYLNGLPENQLGEVVESLKSYEDLFEERHVIPGVTGLVNQISRIPDNNSGFFTFDGDIVVGQVVYALLEIVENEEKRTDMVQAILSGVTTLSGKLDVIETVGHHLNSGHGLVSEAVATDLKKSWRAEVRATPPDELAKEYNLLQVAVNARNSVPGEQTFILPAESKVTFTLLQSAHSQSRSQTVGNRAIDVTDRLAWDTLVALMEHEYVLKLRIDSAREEFGEDAPDLFALADRYLSGWRPPR